MSRAELARRENLCLNPITSMETLDLEPRISANGRSVSFILECKSGFVQCIISRATLEAYFWLPPNANDAKTLRIFRNGANRIHAVAHRKLLADPAPRVELTMADFSRG